MEDLSSISADPLPVVDLHCEWPPWSDHACLIPIRHAIRRRRHQRRYWLSDDVRFPAGNAHERYHRLDSVDDGPPHGR